MFQIKKLKGQLGERQKNGKLDMLRPEDTVLENGTDVHVMDLQSKCRPLCGGNHSDVRDVGVLVWEGRNRRGEESPVFPPPRIPDYKSRDVSQ